MVITVSFTEAVRGGLPAVASPPRGNFLWFAV